LGNRVNALQLSFANVSLYLKHFHRYPLDRILTEAPVGPEVVTRRAKATLCHVAIEKVHIAHSEEFKSAA
jgi:hypothetical protein